MGGYWAPGVEKKAERKGEMFQKATVLKVKQNSAPILFANEGKNPELNTTAIKGGLDLAGL